MSVTFKYLEDCFQEEAELLPEFDFAKADIPMLKLMKMQSSFKLEYDDVKGPVIKQENYVDLCIDTLKIANQENIDIFVSPEYAIPFSLFDHIIKESDIQPKNGKLWCLCCEGIELSVFNNEIIKWKERNIKVIDDAIIDIHENNFVDVLIYIFKLNNDCLCFVPQLKTHPMADGNLECEQSGLSLGKVIYRIGKNKPNMLCSIICADALNSAYIGVSSLFERGDENIILLHPQMNMAPRNNVFSNLRQTIFSNHYGNNLIYISVNCAAGTELIRKSDNKAIKIRNPWSCVYIKNTDKEWVDTQRRFRTINNSRGIGYGYLENLRVDVWYSINENHLSVAKIRKPRSGAPSVNTPKTNLLAEKLFVTNESSDSWIEMACYTCGNDLRNFLEIEKEYEYPLEERDKEKRDKFFGICFGDLEEGQLKIRADEICMNVSISVDEECSTYRREKIRAYHSLLECLRDGKLPHEFDNLKENHMLCLKDGIFNLISKEDEKNKIMVAYISEENEARKVADKFDEILKTQIVDLIRSESIDLIRLGSNMNLCCVFTKDIKNGRTKNYPEFNPKINAPQRTVQNNSIKR